MKKKVSAYHSDAISGFTLIELLIVITIISFLALLVIGSLGPVMRSGRNTKRVADLKKIEAALEEYHTDQGFYPSSSNGGARFSLVPGSDLTDCSGRPSPCTVTRTYLRNIPDDPSFPFGSSDRHYCYTSFHNTQSYGYCDNSGASCYYYELSAYEEDNGNLYNSQCGEGAGYRSGNYVVTPRGELPLPTPPAGPLQRPNS